jgi:hypothetical protein
MPEYTFNCEDCNQKTIKFFTISEYNTNVRCDFCKSHKTTRDYSSDNFYSSYIPSLSECKTIGQYAEKQSKIYGKEKCEKMRESFKTQKTGGIKNLPDGMTRGVSNE